MKKMKKVQLINAPLDAKYYQSLRTGTFPPLNLGILASYLKQSINDCEVELFDGEIDDLNFIINQLDAEFIGINCNTLTYQTALKIAQAASRIGSKVILGGPFASCFPERILKNQEFIDCIVVGDGEESLKLIVENQPNENIPNLAYRKCNSIVQNKSIKTNISPMALPDYCNLPLKKYFKNHVERYADFKPFSASLPIYSKKGCEWRDKTNGGCVFCMIPHFGVTFKNPKHIWNEILYYNEIHGVTFFWDVSDSFADNYEWLLSFKEAKPKSLDVALSIYARANSITKQTVRLFKEVGVFEVFIGAESGDNKILQNTQKGITTEITKRAINLLREEGIKVIVSFVLGLPGENLTTLQKTVSFAKELSEYENIDETSTSIMFPIPGSKAFDNLMKYKGMNEKYSSDILDYEQLKRDWLNHITDIDYDTLRYAENEITNYFDLNNSFSRPKEQVLSVFYC